MLENKPYLKLACQGAAFLGAFATFAVASLYFAQNKIIYLPGTPIQFPEDNPYGYRNPGDRSLPYKRIETKTSDDLILRGWFIHHENPKHHKTIVFMHENAGNIGLRLGFYEAMYHHLNANIVTFAYRGYSHSEGEPNEEGLKLDAQAIVEYVIDEKDIDQSKIFLQGRSLGGAVSIYTAHKYPNLFKGLIIENSFTSLSDMVDHLLFFLKYFKSFVLRNKWTSIDLVSIIEIPILFVTGDKDELVPHEMTLKLHDAAKNSKLRKLFVVKDGTHNDTWYVGGQEYMDTLSSFMSEALKLMKFQQQQQKKNLEEKDESLLEDRVEL